MNKKFPILETECLTLKEIGQENVESFYDIMSRDAVTKFYGMESLTSITDASKIIESFKSTFESNRGIRWGINLKNTDEFIGTIGLNNLNKRGKKAEIGFELHPFHWNSGITSEAIKAVLHFSFIEWDLYRIGAVTFPNNIASINLLKKRGFTEEGRLRGYLYQNEQSHDALIFSLLKKDWEIIN